MWILKIKERGGGDAKNTMKEELTVMHKYKWLLRVKKKRKRRGK